LFEDRVTPRFRSTEHVARRGLLYLHRARTLADLRLLPVNRLESLRGDRRGEHGIRIHDQRRICFRWRGGDAHDVEIVDYHRGAGMSSKARQLDPIHPGEILLEEFLKPMKLSMNRLARDIGVPVGRISEIVRGRRSMSADTALRLGKYFRVSPELWLGLQSDYDLRIARRDNWDAIDRQVAHDAA
jgi:addiction module HigA family antidote